MAFTGSPSTFTGNPVWVNLVTPDSEELEVMCP